MIGSLCLLTKKTARELCWSIWWMSLRKAQAILIFCVLWEWSGFKYDLNPSHSLKDFHQEQWFIPFDRCQSFQIIYLQAFWHLILARTFIDLLNLKRYFMRLLCKVHKHTQQRIWINRISQIGILIAYKQMIFNVMSFLSKFVRTKMLLFKDVDFKNKMKANNWYVSSKLLNRFYIKKKPGKEWIAFSKEWNTRWCKINL